MQESSSSVLAEEKQETTNVAGGMKASEDELTCSVCLELVNVGEVIHSSPCLHQGTCPVCKYRAVSGWRDNEHGGTDASYMV